MRLLWEDRAWSDYLYWQTQDKKTLKRINVLITDIQRSTFEGIGKPEPLKENLSGMWSRRIDDTNRIVYYEKDEIIYIVSCKGHYADISIMFQRFLYRCRISSPLYSAPRDVTTVIHPALNSVSAWIWR